MISFVVLSSLLFVFGFNPMSLRMDQEFYKRHGIADPKDDNGASKTLSAAARRSFFRRRLKHKRSGSKDGKDLVALEALGAESLPITEGGASVGKEGDRIIVIMKTSKIKAQC